MQANEKPNRHENNPDADALESISLADILDFHERLVRIDRAGIPTRIREAPLTISGWLGKMGQRVAVRVGKGDTPAHALATDPDFNSSYQQALLAWIQSRKTSSVQTGSVSENADDSREDPRLDLRGDLSVLEPWVAKGLEGNAYLQRGALHAIGLWILSALACVLFAWNLANLTPKILSQYEQFHRSPGVSSSSDIAFQFHTWCYDHLAWLGGLAVTLLCVAPWCWKLWIGGTVKHGWITKGFSNLCWILYLIAGGLLVSALAITVFLPVIDLIYQVSRLNHE